MKKITNSAAGLLLLTAIISVVIAVMGGYPPRGSLTGTRATLYGIITAPLFLAALGTLVTVPIIMVKRSRSEPITGKSRVLPAIGILWVPLMFLLMQILLPLEAFDVISDASSDLIFHGLFTLFFIVIGNYVVTVPVGSRMGFRNHWTLLSPAIWTKTHRFLGLNLIITALVVGPAAALIDRENAMFILVGAILLVKATTYLYARALGRKMSLRPYEGGLS